MFLVASFPGSLSSFTYGNKRIAYYVGLILHTYHTHTHTHTHTYTNTQLYSGPVFYGLLFVVHVILTLVITFEVYYRWQIRSRGQLRKWAGMLREKPWPPKQKVSVVKLVWESINARSLSLSLLLVPSLPILQPKFVMAIILNLVNFIW